MQPFTARIVDAVRSIPEGRLMTYGSVAEMAGNRRAARQVVRVLHSMGESQGLPWHRVINSERRISLPGELGELQLALLAAEGAEPSLGGRFDANLMVEVQPDLEGAIGALRDDAASEDE
ncbi:methylated-DNA-protein-cysteine methyltransferase related protein [Paenibacillaceae bacterium GAS479]|nr:methylated-DNA-protein-cysteine methyltransferase related protein [Paenibacillaceae bacterium GAS479]